MKSGSVSESRTEIKIHSLRGLREQRRVLECQSSVADNELLKLVEDSICRTQRARCRILFESIRNRKQELDGPYPLEQSRALRTKPLPASDEIFEDRLVGW